MSELEVLRKIVDQLEIAVLNVAEGKILRAFVAVKVKQARALQRLQGDVKGIDGPTGTSGPVCCAGVHIDDDLPLSDGTYLVDP